MGSVIEQIGTNELITLIALSFLMITSALGLTIYVICNLFRKLKRRRANEYNRYSKR